MSQPGKEGKNRGRTDRYGDPLPPGAVARLGTLRWLPNSGILSLAYSPDGKTLASGGLGDVTLWETRTGRQLRVFPMGKQLILSVAFTPDGRLLALGVPDGRYTPPTLWEVVTGKKLGHLQEGDEDTSIAGAIAPDGRAVAAGEAGIRLCRTTAGKKLRRLPGDKIGTSSLAFSPDGKTLASGSGHPLDTGETKAAAVQLWDVATGRLNRRLSGHRGLVGCLAFTPDGRTLVSAGSDETIRFWDVATGKETRRLKGGASALAFSPDGKILTMGVGRIRLWDVAAWEFLPRLAAHEAGVEAVAFSPDGRAVTSVGADDTTRLWEVRTSRQLYQVPGGQSWRASIAFSPDGKAFASGYDRRHVILRDAATGKERRRFWAGPADNLSVTFLRGGALLAGAGDFNGKVFIWDPATGKELRHLETEKFLHCLAISPDCMALATVDASSRASLWDVETGDRVHRLASDDTGHFYAAAFSPDGKILAAELHTRKVELWEVATGKKICSLGQPLPGDSPDTSVALAWSPDGRVLASVGKGNQVYLWAVATGRRLDRLAGHRGPINCLAFVPDGKLLASGSDDSTVLIWDVGGAARRAQPRAGRLPRGELEALWGDLAGEDAARAYRAVRRLMAAPGQAVPFLQRRLQPVPPVDSRQVARLLADLDREPFAAREKATQELERLAEAAEPALRRALGGALAPEARRRVERLVRGVKAARRDPPPGQRRALRAVAALEQIATPEARHVLEAAARGEPAARLTREAKAALGRLMRR